MGKFVALVDSWQEGKSDAFEGRRHFVLLVPIGSVDIERGHAALANIPEQLLDAASAHLSELRHPEPHMAIAILATTKEP